jgi:DNA-binding LytR/AlgR family response regulator
MHIEELTARPPVHPTSDRLAQMCRSVRIHRSAIVQHDRIVALRPATHGDVQGMLNGVSLV